MLNKAKKLVIKTGSALVIDEAGQPRAEWLATLAVDIAGLRAAGKQVIVVSSGAVALGRKTLNLTNKPLELEEKQAAAACGQLQLIHAWSQAFAAHNIAVAQILLTADDSKNRRRYLNARATLDTLLALGALPVINENDTVATQELRIGDNDRLSARVAQMAGADCLVLLSDVDGLYNENPRANPQAEWVPEVCAVTPEIEAYAGAAGNHGTGGMVTKLAAAKIALSAGCHMAITKGDVPNPLKALEEGARATWFIASESPLSARKKWIAGGLHPEGSVVIDAGAAAALTQGKSLLPAGVKEVTGQFERGDAVIITSTEGKTLGRGLIAYSSADAQRILGRNSKEIEQILGFRGRAALIHRDDMVLE